MIYAAGMPVDLQSNVSPRVVVGVFGVLALISASKRSISPFVGATLCRSRSVLAHGVATVAPPASTSVIWRRWHWHPRMLLSRRCRLPGPWGQE
jgi:hypothetical protein